MRSLFRQHVRATMIVLTITLLLSAFTSISLAAGPSITVAGSTTAPCSTGGRPVAAFVQGESFDVNLVDFPNNPVDISFTFPDGRVLNPYQAAALNGVSDYPNLQPYLPQFFDSADATISFAALETWPTGCYSVTVTEILPAGATDFAASTQFVVLPKPHSIQAGNLKLWVQSTGTYQPSGEQGVTVDIFGHGVATNASAFVIEIVQPDGSILNLKPANITLAQGNFKAQFTFIATHQIGSYTIYATATMLSGVIYTAKAQFMLKPALPKLTNNASLIILDPFTTLVPQGTPISIEGRHFTSGPLPLTAQTLVLPNGTQLSLPGAGVPVSASGNVVLPTIVLGTDFPTGTYQLFVTDGLRTASTAWRLIPQQP
ncbi:MAG: hypothetical protein HGA19_14725 [Oscillochloris sp.]|nr:hypothetical protein [Oscillochloris sp.]